MAEGSRPTVINMPPSPPPAVRRRGCGLAIELRHVDLRRAGRQVLCDLSLRFEGGHRYALLGENGSGKTQLLKILALHVWPTPTGRELLRHEIDGVGLDPREAKRRIAYLGAELQDKYARYGWNPSVQDLLATGLRGSDLLLELPSVAEQRLVAQMLRVCGIEGLRTRKFLSLSYGQKRLALLARALMGKPDWLLLDEFYNGLDRDCRLRAEKLLETARKRGQAWVAAAHRVADLPPGTSELLQLHAGRLTFRGKLGRRHRLALAREAAERPIRRPPRIAGPGVDGVPDPDAPVLVRLRNADLFVNYHCVLRGLNWDLRRGEHWAILGANGSGKTSFLKLLYGDLAPAHGGVIERLDCPAGTAIEVWKRRIGYVSPELQSDYASDVRLKQLVASGAHASIGLVEPSSAKELATARRWLGVFGLGGAANRRPREISYGQLRRALIARALAHAPSLLLLDEPLTGLDSRQRAAVKQRLEQLARAGSTIVAAVHHLEDLPDCVRRVLRLGSRRAVVAHTMPRRAEHRMKSERSK
ncbi:MAG: ATP-binding cassette domain-containing protein [Steroidobacteraceae bacterium]|nr:ATP-binding cassette domain-containing protein [Steroidobacteraceae bacterium]